MDHLLLQPLRMEQNPVSSINGATVLKLDQQLEIDTSIQDTNESRLKEKVSENREINQETSSQGISIENASYIENNLEVENRLDNKVSDEEYTPKLFSEENSHQQDEENQNDGLFEKNSNDDEEFEIPAFLRKQKF